MIHFNSLDQIGKAFLYRNKTHLKGMYVQFIKRIDYLLKYQLKWLNNTIIVSDPHAAADAEVETIDNLKQVKKMNPWYPLPAES
jgi:hypothetical protein